MQERTFAIVQTYPLGCNRVRLALVSQDNGGPSLNLDVNVDGGDPAWSSELMTVATVLSVNLDGQGRGTVMVRA